ncbi:prepilin-type N-terminal cleavage/methylation domain-containing protein [Thalassotalea sp. 42_200_T64]|nr:prepilin-type N-terminal cleavage/methylation domain-containing protein [Thalassotalea sp. 42_200_T64]
MPMKKHLFRQKGFSLLEVMIALIISAIALLGLAAGQVKSLQFARNSFDYTVSIIHANNAVERIWIDICQLQDARQAFDQQYIESLTPALQRYTLTLTGVAEGSFANDFTVSVQWSDQRMTDDLPNAAAINASYPQLPAGCNG